MTEATEEVKAPKPDGVGKTATKAILAGMDNDQAFAAARAAHPEAKTTMASINWYRNKLRGDGAKCDDGSDVKTSRELKPKAEKAPKAPKKAKEPKAPAADPLA